MAQSTGPAYGRGRLLFIIILPLAAFRMFALLVVAHPIIHQSSVAYHGDNVSIAEFALEPQHRLCDNKSSHAPVNKMIENNHTAYVRRLPLTTYVAAVLIWHYAIVCVCRNLTRKQCGFGHKPRNARYSTRSFDLMDVDKVHNTIKEMSCFNFIGFSLQIVHIYREIYERKSFLCTKLFIFFSIKHSFVYCC